MRCPHGDGDLRPFPRGPVTVYRCAGCRGTFLDGGDLERLITAESGPAGFDPIRYERPPHYED